MSFSITKLTAFVSITDGEEGVISILGNDGYWLPCICADEKRIESIYPAVVQLCKDYNIDFRIIQFDNRTDVTDQIHQQFKNT